MDEFYYPDKPKDLHVVAALQEVEIRPNITARPLVESHASRLLAILDADPDIRNRVTVASRLHEVEDVAKEIEEIKKDPGLIRYAILDGENPIGLVSLWRDDGFFGTPPNLDDYGFGYLLDPNERGKGIVTDTITALMDTVQQNLYVRQFVAFCEDDNAESVAVLAALGFEKNGEAYLEPTHGWIEYKYVRPPHKPELEKSKEADNARKFVTEPLDSEFLEEHGAIPSLLITDWLEVGEDNETKVVYKKFGNGDVQIFLISKTTKDGKRTKEKEEITEEKYKELLGSSVRHVEKKRHEFAYTQNGISFTVNYDEFSGGKLFMLDVDASSEEEKNAFNPNDFPRRLVEVTGNMQYSGYRVVDIV